MLAQNRIEIALGLAAREFTTGLTQSRREFGAAMAGMAQAAADQSEKISQSLSLIDSFKGLKQQVQDIESLWQSARTEVDRLGASYRSALSMGNDPQAREFQRELKRDYDAAFSSASQLRQEMERQKTTLTGLSERLSGAGIDLSNVEESQRRLRRELETTNREMQQQARAAQAFGVIGVRSSRDIEAEIHQLENAYRDLARSGEASTSDLARAHNQVQERVQGLRGEMSGLDQAMGRVRDTIGGLVAAYAGFETIRTTTESLKESVLLYAKFDDIIRQVGATSGATSTELSEMAELAKKMGEETRFSTSEAASGFKALSLGGLSAKEMMESLPGVLELASAGAVDMEKAAKIATDSMAQFNLKAKDLSEINDILVTAFTKSATTVSDLGMAMGYAGPVANAAGSDFRETATALALLAKNGFSGEKAGTALRTAYAQLLNPTKEVQEAIEKLGLKIRDTSGKFLPMTQILRNLREAGASVASMFKLFGTEAAPAMMAAVNMDKEAFESLIAVMNKTKGKAAQVAVDMEAGIGGQLRTLQSAWEGVSIAIGKAVDQHRALDFDLLINTINKNKAALVDVGLAWVNLAAKLAEVGLTVAKVALDVTQFLVDWREVVLVLGSAAVAIKTVSIATRLLIALQGAQWFLSIGQAATAFTVAVGAQGLAGALALARTRLIALAAVNVTAFLFSGATGALGFAAALGKLGLAGAAIAAVGGLGYLGYGLIETIPKIRSTEKAVGESTLFFAETQKNLTARLKELSTQLNFSIPDMKTFNKLQKAGAIVADETAGGWRLVSRAVAEAALAQEEASSDMIKQTEELKDKEKAAASDVAKQTEELKDKEKAAIKELADLERQRTEESERALRDLLQKKLQAAEHVLQANLRQVEQSLQAEKRLANEIIALEDRKRDARLSTEDRLRILRERSMSEQEREDSHATEAYKKLKEAQKILAQNNLTPKDAQWAEQLAKQAQEAYVNLKDTDTAIQGVKAAGAVLDAIYSKQEEAAKKSLEAQKKNTVEFQKLTEAAKGVVDSLKESLDEIPENTNKKVTLSAEIKQAFEDLETIQTSLDNLKDKTVTVKIRRVEEGGDGAAPAFARGGYLPGWGSKDDIPAWLQAGEFVLRKEAVRKLGLANVHAINQLRIPKFARGGMVHPLRVNWPSIPRFATGGVVPRFAIPKIPQPATVGFPSSRQRETIVLELRPPNQVPARLEVLSSRQELNRIIGLLKEAGRGVPA